MALIDTIRGILRKEYAGQPHWKGFVFWWLSTLGYTYNPDDSRVQFVDGNRDGGIDAIAWPLTDRAKETVFVVQSKFYAASPTGKDLRKFMQAVDAIRGDRDEFRDWLDTCRPELHPIYRKVREARDRCRFVLVAPARIDPSMRRKLLWKDIEIHDSMALATLERSFSQGRTPRLDEITLKGASRPIRVSETSQTTMWVFTVPAHQLGIAFERYGDVLFAGNIRYALRGGTAKRVRHGIDETLRNASHELVFSHNGITISGNRIRRSGNVVTMDSASIVNGAQTVSYFGLPRMMRLLEDNPARIMVKFVQVDNSEHLDDIEAKVAYRSNNQNKVDPSDLMIGLVPLVSLQRHFRRNGIHLERKKGEAKILGQHRIPKERLAQVLAAIESPELAVLGKRKQELFEQRAEKIFRDFDATEDSRAEAVAWTRIDAVMNWSASQFSNLARRKRAQLARLASLTAFHKAIRGANIKTAFMRRMNRWEDNQYDLEWFLERSFKAVFSTLLSRSAKDRRNEPAFYKSVLSVSPAVRLSAKRVAPKIRKFFRSLN